MKFKIIFKFMLIIVLASVSTFAITVELENALGEPRSQMPVFIPIKDIFGDDYDFSSISFDKFTVLNKLGQEVEYSVLTQPPYDKKGKDDPKGKKLDKK